MPTSYIEYDNREDWLAGRTKSIGASEVSAAVGLNPFMSQLELWEIKTGRKKPKDLSNVSRVVFGQNAEGLIRDLYMLEHPEFTLEYHPYRVYFQTELPFLTATLDGELIRVEDGVKGIYEGKTAECTKKQQWENWNGKVPEHYYTQLCHQLWCAGSDYKFSILNAKIKGLNGDSSLRSYEYNRDIMKADIEWLVTEAEKFWYYVKEDKRPPISLTL